MCARGRQDAPFSGGSRHILMTRAAIAGELPDASAAAEVTTDNIPRGKERSTKSVLALVRLTGLQVYSPHLKQK